MKSYDEELRPQAFVLKENGYGRVFDKPLRFVIFRDGAVMALMQERGTKRYCVFAQDQYGRLSHSGAWDGPLEVINFAFREVAAEIAEPQKTGLVEMLVDENGELRKDVSTEETMAIIDRLFRLEMLDENKCEVLAEEHRQFIATHTPAEIEAEAVRLQAEMEIKQAAWAKEEREAAEQAS